MWLFLNDSFLSIVEPSLPKPGQKRSTDLLVRARFKGDIEKVFHGVAVRETPDRDYRFRAIVSRSAVKAAMQSEVDRIDYHNFKGSVDDRPLHDAYMRVWSVMEAEQRRRLPKRRTKAPMRDLFPGGDPDDFLPA